MKSIIVVIGLLICSSTISYSQINKSGRIYGRTVDAETKEPLIGAIVYLHHLYYFDKAESSHNIQFEERPFQRTFTDFDGKFSFLNVPHGKYLLITKYIGYQKTNFIIQDFQEEQTQVTIHVPSDEKLINYHYPYRPPLNKREMNSISRYFEDQIINLPVDR